MKRPLPLVLAVACATLTGCRSHMLFVEEEHGGLKVAFQPDNPSPAEVSLALRRSVVAVVPQKSTSYIPTDTSKDLEIVQPGQSGNAPSPQTGTNGTAGSGTKVIVYQDPNELMSLYTRFRANVGLTDPIEFKHFLATGNAALELLADEDSLRGIAEAFNDTGTAKPPASPTH